MSVSRQRRLFCWWTAADDSTVKMLAADLTKNWWHGLISMSRSGACWVSTEREVSKRPLVGKFPCSAFLVQCACVWMWQTMPSWGRSCLPSTYQTFYRHARCQSWITTYRRYSSCSATSSRIRTSLGNVRWWWLWWWIWTRAQQLPTVA